MVAKVDTQPSMYSTQLRVSTGNQVMKSNGKPYRFEETDHTDNSLVFLNRATNEWCDIHKQPIPSLQGKAINQLP